MITDKDISAFIYSIENDLPVSSWRINEIDIWPIIRVKIQAKLRASTSNKLSRKTTSYSSYSRFTSSQKVKRAFSSYFNFFRLKKVDFIATSNFAHRSIYKGEYYNKFYDPIMDEVNGNGLILEHNSKEFYQNHPIHNENKVSFFEDYFYYHHIVFSILKKVKLYSPLKRVELENYGQLLKKIDKLEGVGNISSEFELKKLESIVFNLLVYKKVYTRILKKTKPKFTFQICHYNANSIALSMASKELNIPSVEIQHGGQPKAHMAYSNWLNIPKQGFNTLPKIYWNWNKESQTNLQDWLSKNEFHTSVILGNPWTDFVKKQLSKQEKKYILYSLQPLDFGLIFPANLIDFIRNNTQYKWWFRLHPTDINRKEEYLDFFKKNGIESLVFFDDGSSRSLPESLSQSLLHITYNSGTAIEAADFNVKTIFLDSKSSIEYFGSLIESQDAFVIETNFEELFHKVIALKSKKSEEKVTYTSCFEVLEN